MQTEERIEQDYGVLTASVDGGDATGVISFNQLSYISNCIDLVVVQPAKCIMHIGKKFRDIFVII